MISEHFNPGSIFNVINAFEDKLRRLDRSRFDFGVDIGHDFFVFKNVHGIYYPPQQSFYSSHTIIRQDERNVCLDEVSLFSTDAAESGEAILNVCIDSVIQSPVNERQTQREKGCVVSSESIECGFFYRRNEKRTL